MWNKILVSLDFIFFLIILFMKRIHRKEKKRKRKKKGKARKKKKKEKEKKENEGKDIISIMKGSIM